MCSITAIRRPRGHREIPPRDVGQFMGEHRAQLSQGQQPKQPFGAAHRCRPRAVADSEDVRLRRGGHEQAGHWQVRGKGQFPHDPVQVRAFHLTDRMGAEGSKDLSFRMEINNPAESDQQRADGRGTDEPQPERSGGQERRAQRADEQRRAHSVAGHRHSPLDMTLTSPREDLDRRPCTGPLTVYNVPRVWQVSARHEHFEMVGESDRATQKWLSDTRMLCK
jgi:hypothetical protein